MRAKRVLRGGVIVSLFATVVAVPVMALGGDALKTVNTTAKDAENVVEEQTSNVKSAVNDIAETARTLTSEELREKQQEHLKERMLALKQAREDRKQARIERLEGSRLAQCENREERINGLIGRSVQHSRDRLARIQRIEEGIKKFYETKNLSSDGYQNAVLTADEKEADAAAVIDSLADTGYSCDEVDARNPGQAISQVNLDRQSALKSYRAAVKDLLDVVRSALDAKEKS